VLSELMAPVNFPCGEFSYRGGDPTDPRMGAIVLKVAWMELPESDGPGRHLGRDRREKMHTEKLLVWNPAYRNSTGVASCRLATMGAAGVHIAHKTVNQPNWIWSTFEHQNNAPDCTSLPDAGNMGGDENNPPSGPSTACPISVKHDYNLFPASCSDDGADPLACQTCNATPVSNAPIEPDGVCDNTAVMNDVAWCLDLPPADEAGMTRACRQVPVAENYPTAHFWNNVCTRRLGGQSVWGNYQLISTQWFDAASPGECVSGSTIPATRTVIRPQVDITGDGQSTRPYLANTTMETYVRANCMACHNNAEVETADPKQGTDMMYFLELEVPPPT
jgi:hypothetical protein